MNDGFTEVSVEDIYQYASRYENKENFLTIPEPGDIFALLTKPTNANVPYSFNGYNVLKKYVVDDQSKPIGKWVFVYFDSLASFPPQENCILKLQPPHLAFGTWQNSDRSMIFHMVSDFNLIEETHIKSKKEVVEPEAVESASNVLTFPSKKF